ncbi:MAG: 2-hydroxyacyl-CoA dehydratase subunit D [Candidatus Hodarchaeales archaeon]|jgi:benzoyl-CoA reductase/2-hydroxyglutaryl-CoA dehydratase subunit BcrC/BadD/HgdB
MLSDIESDILSHPLEYYLENYFEALTEFEKLSIPMIGYFTNKTPVELLDAMNLHPLRIFAFKHPKSHQGAYERYIQTFACSWLRGILDNGLVDGYKDLKGIMFSTGTCDSLQNVSDIWQKVFPNQLTYNLTFPIQSNTAAIKYLVNEFKQFLSLLEKNFGLFSSFNLKESIQKYNQKRKILQNIANFVSKGHLHYASLAKIAYLSDLLPVNEFTRLFRNLSPTDGKSSSSQEETPRLLVSGGMWDNWKLFDIPEWDGLVADDLSFGYRNFSYFLPETDSLESYVKSQLTRIPEPTAYDENHRLESLEKQIKDHKIDGVVLLTMKFCDPDAFELVPLRKHLESLEIPFLNLETSPDLSNLAQLRTRLSAFSEILQ